MVMNYYTVYATVFITFRACNMILQFPNNTYNVSFLTNVYIYTYDFNWTANGNRNGHHSQTYG